MKGNKYFILIKNTLIFGIGLLGSKFVQFILLPYFTNVLTPEEYGIIDLVITFANLMIPIVTVNLADAVLRFGLSQNVKKEELLENSFVVLGISILVTIALSPLLYFYSTICEWRYYVVAIIIFQGLRTNFSLYVKANERVIVYSLDSIFTAMIIATSDIILISHVKMGIKGYFLSEIFGNMFSILFLLFRGKIIKDIRIRKKKNWKLLKEMLTYSAPLMFNAISWWITNFSDRIVLDGFFSEREVGLYSVSSKMPAIVTTGLSVFTQAWIMSAVKEYETSKDTNFFQKIYVYYCSVLFAAVSLVILIVKPFMKIYVGENFQDAWVYVPVLLLGVVFLGISNFYGAIYAAAKANIKEVRSTMACAISNIVLNILLIPKAGIMGAVFATMLSYVIIVGIRMIDTQSIVKIQRNVIGLILNTAFIMIEIYGIVKLNNWILACGMATIILVINIWNVFVKRRTI